MDVRRTAFRTLAMMVAVGCVAYGIRDGQRDRAHARGAEMPDAGVAPIDPAPRDRAA